MEGFCLYKFVVDFPDLSVELLIKTFVIVKSKAKFPFKKALNVLSFASGSIQSSGKKVKVEKTKLLTKTDLHLQSK